MNENLLKAYSDELGLFDSMTLESLIISHRYLRELAQKDNQERRSELELARNAGREQGFATVAHGEYVKVSTLMEMTVSELVEFLARELL